MRRRIIISLGLLLALCLIGDAVVMLSLRHSVRELSSFIESHRIQSLRADLVTASVLVESTLRSYLPGQGCSREDLLASGRRLETSIRSCAGCHHQGAAEGNLEEIRDTFHRYQGLLTELLAVQNAHRRDTLATELRDLSDRLVRQTTDTAESANQHLMTRSTKVAAGVGRAGSLLFGTLIAVLAFGGFVAFHLRQHLTRPVRALLEDVEQVRNGKLTHDHLIDADEEFRTLADAIHNAYDELKKAQESMREAEKQSALGRLTAGVAHEVFNPLASISSTIQLMRRHSRSDQQAEQFGLLMKETTRIFRIVREMLTFSRPPTAEEHEPVDIEALLSRATAIIEQEQRAQGVTITSTVAPDLCLVSGDADRLALVFTNIMLNAIDAMSTGRGGRGTLTMTGQRAGDRIILEFADTGPGMTKEQINHAFEPFVTTKEPGAGTGLGLWICYQIIERHNGIILINSRLDEGTTVSIELPCRQAGPD